MWDKGKNNMGGRYCAINSPFSPWWGQKSRGWGLKDFRSHCEPRGELIAQYQWPRSFRYRIRGGWVCRVVDVGWVCRDVGGGLVMRWVCRFVDQEWVCRVVNGDEGVLVCGWGGCLGINSLWRSDAIWQQGSGSTLAQVMACCLMAPSHFLNQCWLIIGEVRRHSYEGNFTRDTSTINR